MQTLQASWVVHPCGPSFKSPLCLETARSFSDVQGEGLERLVSYVDNAMLRWAARAGRYDMLSTISRKGKKRP
jgi:hypothetical protein